MHVLYYSYNEIYCMSGSFKGHKFQGLYYLNFSFSIFIWLCSHTCDLQKMITKNSFQDAIHKIRIGASKLACIWNYGVSHVICISYLSVLRKVVRLPMHNA